MTTHAKLVAICVAMCSYEPVADWLVLLFVDVQGFKHYSFPVVSVTFTRLGGVRVLLVLVSLGVE